MEIKYEKGFIETIEQHPALLYADTDSLYICVQNKDPKMHGSDFEKFYVTDKNDKNQWESIINQTLTLADEINSEIDNQLRNVIGSRAGLDPKYQSIFFKTEMIALRMMQFNVKKTYSLLYFYDEGKVLEHPKIKKTGGQIKKSSTPSISKRIFEDIYHTMMYEQITDIQELREKIFNDLYSKYVDEFKKYFTKWNFKEIGLPYKYGFGKNMTKWNWGALFYNTFFKDELRAGASMFSLYIRYNQNKLKSLLAKMNNELKQYQLKPDMVEPKWDMISVPVELGEEFYKKYKDKIKWLADEIEFSLSWDHNRDIIIDKKFLQFKTFFD